MDENKIEELSPELLESITGGVSLANTQDKIKEMILALKKAGYNKEIAANYFIRGAFGPALKIPGSKEEVMEYVNRIWILE